jgi:RND family efflux transporter MFP subunit
MRNWFLFLPLILSLVGCHSASSSKSSLKPLNTNPSFSQKFKIQTVALRAVPQYYELPGTVESQRNIDVSSKVIGTVKQIFVHTGEKVYSNEVLALLSEPEVSENKLANFEAVHAAKIELQKAKTAWQLSHNTFIRYRNLFESKALSQQEYQELLTKEKEARLNLLEAQTNYQKALAVFHSTEIQENYLRIQAPFSGVVTKKWVEKGSVVMPGQPILSLINLSHPKIVIHLNQTFLNQIFVGEKVQILYQNHSLEGKIKEIIPQVDPVARTFPIKIVSLKTVLFPNGYFIKVKIPLGFKNEIVIPQSSVVFKGDLIGVYVVGKDLRIKFQLIKPGLSLENHELVVLSGLKSGEKILLNPSEANLEGEKIQ